MAKLRNVQFYRNTSPVVCESHDDARGKALTAFNNQAASMLDGEMLLYRYTIGSDTTVHTITGVVRKNGNTTNVEIVANADMFSTAAFTGKAEDVTYVNTVSGLAATNVQDAIDEVEGRVDTLEQGVQSLNAVMGVIVDSTELTKDANGKVTIDTDDDHAYVASTNPLATVETVTSAVSALNSTIGAEFAALDGSATIASVTDGVVTLKAGVSETDGIIANSTGTDIALAKVATTGEAEDVVKSTNSAAAYNTTAGEISSDWVSVVNSNALADGDTVDVDLNKLDNKIAGLADEMIANEQVTAAAFNSVKDSVGLESNFALDLSDDTTNIIRNDTNVKAALLDLADAITDGESKVKDVTINGTTIVESNGVAGIMVDGTYNASNNKIATVGTVNTAIGNLDGSATIASETNGVVTLKLGVTETDGVISNSTGTDITLAKVATTGSAEDVTYTYVNGVSGTVQAAGNIYENRIAALEALPTYDVVVVTTLPTADADTMHKIYLKALDPAGPSGDIYEEYITLRTGTDPNYTYTWEKLGTTAASLEGYVKTVNINGKNYNVPENSTTVTLGTDYITNVTTSGATYVNAVVGTAVKNTTAGTVTLPITINEKIQAVSTADSSHMGLAEASDVRSYVDTTIQGLDKANSTVGTNIQVSYEEVDGIVTITNVAGPNASPTSDDAAVANVQVVQTDGEITDVVVTNVSADVTYNATAGTLTADTATGAVTGGDIATIKSYIDAKAGAANTTINATGEGITVNSTTGSSQETIYQVNVELAPNAVVGNTTTLSQAGNLLKITSDHKLTISDTWDCGEY